MGRIFQTSTSRTLTTPLPTITPTTSPRNGNVWLYITDLRLYYWSKRTEAKRRSPVRQLPYNPFLGVETATFLLGMLTVFLSLLAFCKLRRCIRHRWRLRREAAREASSVHHTSSTKKTCSPTATPPNSPLARRRINLPTSPHRLKASGLGSAIYIPVRRLSRSTDAICFGGTTAKRELMLTPTSPSRIFASSFAAPIHRLGSVRSVGGRAGTAPPDHHRWLRGRILAPDSGRPSTLSIDNSISPPPLTPEYDIAHGQMIALEKVEI